MGWRNRGGKVEATTKRTSDLTMSREATKGGTSGK